MQHGERRAAAAAHGARGGRGGLLVRRFECSEKITFILCIQLHIRPVYRQGDKVLRTTKMSQRQDNINVYRYMSKKSYKIAVHPMYTANGKPRLLPRC